MSDPITRQDAGTRTAHPDHPEHDMTDEVTGAAAAGIGGATLGAVVGAAGGPVGAVVGGAIGAVIGAAAGGAAGAAVDVAGTEDVRPAGSPPLTDTVAPLDHLDDVDDRDTMDPA